MGKQSSDSAQKGPGLKSAVTSAAPIKTASPQMGTGKGVAMPAPGLRQAKGGWNNGKGS